MYLKHYRARVSCEPPSLLSVTPDAIDFGDVPQGGSKTQDVRIVNASNVSLTIQAAALRAGSDTAFTLSAVPALPFSVAPGAAVEFEVTYTPTSVGEASGELEISGDIAGGVEVIVLAGSGISYEQQISNLVSAFDEAVAAGDLRGSGAGASANERLQALRNMLVRAGDLVEAGSISQACVQLADALARTDGRVPPVDFVTGGAASELAAEIVALRTRLACP